MLTIRKDHGNQKANANKHFGNIEAIVAAGFREVSAQIRSIYQKQKANKKKPKSSVLTRKKPAPRSKSLAL